MSRRIKLIWDFRGPDALHTAEHHQIHLDEFVAAKKIPETQSGFEELSELYAIAFLTVNQEDMLAVRDALRPHRGEVG
jgi:hypothetical protein